MMMKRVALALMLMCVPHTASAQASSASGSLSAQYASSCAPTTCVTLGMGNMSGVGVQVTGTWVGTLSFLASVDGVQPYVAVSMTPFASSTTATTATANGAWSASVVAQFVQVRFTARTSGTAVVRMRAVPLVAKG